MYPKILCNITSCANEAWFIGQRNKFHLRMKPTCCTSPENTYESPDFRSAVILGGQGVDLGDAHTDGIIKRGTATWVVIP